MIHTRSIEGQDRLEWRLAEIANRDDTTGLAADGLREAADTITTLKDALEDLLAASQPQQATGPVIYIGEAQEKARAALATQKDPQ